MTYSGQIVAQGLFTDFTVSFEDPVLRPYQNRAVNRLNFILEQVQLGADANLGYAKVTWLPDSFVRIRYIRHDGITQPIIVVRVEFQEGVTADDVAFLRQQEPPDDDDDGDDGPPVPPDPEYIPFCWVGIAAFNHQLSGGIPGNMNIDFWGYPIDPRLVGFDPTIGGSSTIRRFTSSVETMPGAYIVGSSWIARAGHGSEDQTFLQINSGATVEMNDFAVEQGTFQDGDWHFTYGGVGMGSIGGMYAFEHLDTFVTAPKAAYGTGLDKLPDNYWKRSIVIPGPEGISLPSGNVSLTFDLGGGTAALISTTYSGGFLPGNIQSGRYEIGAWAGGFHCEATTANLHIRVVLGQADPGGGGSSITVLDFFPSGIGNPCGETRQAYQRVQSLGGNPTCDLNAGNPKDNTFGPNDGGVGWWDSSIYIDVVNGQANVEGASRDDPFFGINCESARQHSCDDQACVGGCSGDVIVAPAHSLAYPSGFVVSHGAGAEDAAFDLRGGVIWHMARVVQTDVDTQHICYVMLVGNDGAQGGPCSPCQSFSYGTTMPASGYSGLTELGEDLRGVQQGHFQVGQLVTVIGWTDAAEEACQVTPGGWRLIVTEPSGAGQDFTSLFWQQLRCPGSAPVDKFFKSVEDAYANRLACNGGPLSVKCGCVAGAFACV